MASYQVSYSDIAVLFPVRKREYLRYYFLYWIKQALEDEGIPYSLIIPSESNQHERAKFSATKGVVVSTIESSLGLDFKAVVFAGLYPYNYVFPDEKTSKEVKSWSAIKAMTEEEQNLVQSQMRSIYTACSRARDILYVLSDLKPGLPMSEIIEQSTLAVESDSYATPKAGLRKSAIKGGKPKLLSAPKEKIQQVIDHVTIKAVVLETKKNTAIEVNLAKHPAQKKILGKKWETRFLLMVLHLHTKSLK